MIVSVHLADVGRLRAQRVLLRGLDASKVAGMTYAEAVFAARLGNLVPRPRPGRIGLIGAWEDDAALDRFLAGHSFAEQLAGGWHARLEPLHRFGSWAGLDDLPMNDSPAADDEPVAAVTGFGRFTPPRLSRSSKQVLARADRVYQSVRSGQI